MPRWARFLSCSITSLLLSLGGFLLAANGREGTDRFWRGLVDFLATPSFWYLVLFFGLLAAVALVFGRMLVNSTGQPGPVAGLLSGVLIGLAYAAFLLAGHTADWGGPLAAVVRISPEVLYFTLPFGLSAAFATWLWDRLD